MRTSTYSSLVDYLRVLFAHETMCFKIKSLPRPSARCRESLEEAFRVMMMFPHALGVPLNPYGERVRVFVSRGRFDRLYYSVAGMGRRDETGGYAAHGLMVERIYSHR
jgi:hypothetical protein